MQFNDNLATRRALDQRPRPFREFSVGDEVACVEMRHWKKCTWQTMVGLNGVVLASSREQLRGNYVVAMPESVIKAAP